ncbi:hypothetical protein L3Y34_006933 [Caenorhabditis briggsae]|uniref:Uncharacterized protein n=1 Tax=Caenorhabditis briggsae TaxID=6238 RepID=A0AAE9CYH6_CAEBR|nr:hypothetical protein L3Y34_006933 [Caenorhabditis briggsae]
MYSDIFDPDHVLFLRYTFTIDSIISTSIPCVLFTFLTGMLVLEVKKANKNRSKLFSSSKDKESRNNTQLVLYFTLTFFVALFPLGVVSAIVNHIVEKVGFTVRKKICIGSQKTEVETKIGIQKSGGILCTTVSSSCYVIYW